MLKIAERRPAMKRSHSSTYEEENEDISVDVYSWLVSEQGAPRSIRSESVFSKVYNNRIMASISTMCVLALESSALRTEPQKSAWHCEKQAISLNW